MCDGLQDENFVAFRDICPAAAEHIIVITKAHVPSLYSLLPNDEDIKLGATILLPILAAALHE